MELLEQAARWLEKYGWTQGLMYDPYEESACILGALRWTISHHPAAGPTQEQLLQEDAAVRTLCRYLYSNYDFDWLIRFAGEDRDICRHVVAIWNDRYCLTKQQAIDTLRAAARSCKEEPEPVTEEEINEILSTAAKENELVGV